MKILDHKIKNNTKQWIFVTAIVSLLAISIMMSPTISNVAAQKTPTAKVTQQICTKTWHSSSSIAAQKTPTAKVTKQIGLETTCDRKKTALFFVYDTSDKSKGVGGVHITGTWVFEFANQKTNPVQLDVVTDSTGHAKYTIPYLPKGAGTFIITATAHCPPNYQNCHDPTDTHSWPYKP